MRSGRVGAGRWVVLDLVWQVGLEKSELLVGAILWDLGWGLFME